MEFVIAGLAATSAGFLTNPLEVIKHHMEISKKSQFNNKNSSFLHTGLQVAKQDGIKSLQKGLSPALGAYLVSYGMKLGTYQFGHSRGLTTNSDGKIAMHKSILTSCTGGLLGQYLSNPFYLLKYQYEVSTMQNAANASSDSTSYVDTMKRIYREQGIRGFFRGATTSLPRAVIGTSQLTSFAVAKENLTKLDVLKNNSLITTILASAVAGIVLTMAMTPFDLIITKMYKQALGAKSSGQVYNGYFDCMRKIYMQNGLKPFYKGMGPLYLKLGPHTILCLVFWEELKSTYENCNEKIYNDKNNYNFVTINTFYEKSGFFTTNEPCTNYFGNNIDDNSKSIYWN